jgi:prophage antirepressor-like protein
MVVINEPFFVAKDVADILGYSETNDITRWLESFDPEQIGVSNKT